MSGLTLYNHLFNGTTLQDWLFFPRVVPLRNGKCRALNCFAPQFLKEKYRWHDTLVQGLRSGFTTISR